jgi:hypothetical protein
MFLSKLTGLTIDIPNWYLIGSLNGSAIIIWIVCSSTFIYVRIINYNLYPKMWMAQCVYSSLLIHYKNAQTHLAGVVLCYLSSDHKLPLLAWFSRELSEETNSIQGIFWYDSKDILVDWTNSIRCSFSCKFSLTLILGYFSFRTARAHSGRHSPMTPQPCFRKLQSFRVLHPQHPGGLPLFPVEHHLSVVKYDQFSFSVQFAV